MNKDNNYIEKSNSTINSLYIPIVSSFINEEFIKYSFMVKKIASVERVDFVYNNNKERREAFIHIDSWHDNINSKKMQSSLEKKNNYKFYYHEENSKIYWPLLVNKNPLSQNSELRKSNKVYTIEDRVETLSEQLNKLQSITLHNNAILSTMGINNQDTKPNKRNRYEIKEFQNNIVPILVPSIITN